MFKKAWSSFINYETALILNCTCLLSQLACTLT